MWHVSSRSGVATLRTAIHLLLSGLIIRGYIVCNDSNNNIRLLSDKDGI